MKVRSFLGIVAAFLFLATQLPAQIITNVTPPLGGHGDFVQIFGNGFAPGNKRPNTLTIKIGGATSTTSTNAVVSDSEIDITNVPTGATNGFIQITFNGTTMFQSPQPFIVVPTNTPYATNFTPLFGANSTPVVVKGVHFQSANVTNATFNGVRAAAFAKISDNEVDITAPIGVTTGPITLLAKSGSTFSTITNLITTATNFFVQPVITSFAPTNGGATTNVILTGTNFIGISGITFGGVTAGDYTISNNTTIRVAVPSGASTGKIIVQPPAGTALASASSPKDFRIVPNITSISPGAGPTNTQITVSGTGLNEKSPRPDVTIGGVAVPAANFGTVTATSLTFNAPANAVSGPISITTTNGSTTSAQIFYLPPVITTFTPSIGGLGTPVHVSGFNFTNATSVAFNGVTTSSFITNNNDMSTIAPLGVTSGTISVTTPGGTANSSQLFYVAPTISDFSPTHGLPGLRVTINGTSFTNVSAVSFNGTPAASFLVTNNFTLSAVVPTNVTTGKITVTAPGGSVQSATDFTLDTADLGITASDSQDPVFVGSNFVYTIIITNAGPITALNVRLTNTLPASVILKSASTTVGTLATNINPIIGSLGDMPNQSTATIQLMVASTVLGTITNTATVGTDSFDPNLGNNSVNTSTTIWPLPFLSIANLMTNGLVQVSWPTQLSGFTLQSRTNLATDSWINDSTARSVTGTNISVIETNLDTSRFYRLTN